MQPHRRSPFPAGTSRDGPRASSIAPQGELTTFDYTPDGGATATASDSAHADAIGSVPAIPDSTGDLVAHSEYDAWVTLPPTRDFGRLLGWSYLFVGSLGVRWDAATGLYNMRQRWYDARCRIT